MAEEMQVDDGAQGIRTVKVNYPPNSNKARAKGDKPAEKTGPAEKKVEKVISGEVVKRKKPLGRKIADVFKGDDMHSVGNFILMDVVVPAVKQMVSDAISQGVERSLYGDSRGRRPSSSGGTRYTNYSSYSRSSSPAGRAGEADGPRTMSHRARAAHDFDEVVLATRGEAEEVLDRLSDLVRDYDVATVSDLYELVGITGSFTDEKWGWTDLRGASVRPVREGYLLVLPRTQLID
jgi:hypothetical protein